MGECLCPVPTRVDLGLEFLIFGWKECCPRAETEVREGPDCGCCRCLWTPRSQDRRSHQGAPVTDSPSGAGTHRGARKRC